MTARNGEVMGVTFTRAAIITNTKAVAQACNYHRGKVIVSLIDPKREVRERDLISAYRYPCLSQPENQLVIERNLSA